jgi:3-dehydroquinate dehydratase-2
MNVLVLHGPNLNQLGVREPEIYGKTTLAEIDASLIALGRARGAEVRCFQSNHEGALIDRIHEARGWAEGLLVNAGGLTHTSVALRDAISGSALPAIEVHLSNIFAREEFRHRSLISGVCVAVVSGFGAESYRLALDGLLTRLAR